MAILDQIEKWQTGISSLVGFFGVMLTLWWNARAARRLQIDIRRADREAVIAAMLGELRVARDTSANNALKAREAIPGDGLHIPSRPVTGHVVNAMLAKPNGLLADTIEKVVVANALIEELPQRMLVLASLHHIEQSMTGMIYVPHQSTNAAAAVFEVVNKSAVEAVRALEADRANNR